MSGAARNSGYAIFWLDGFSSRWNTALYLHEHVAAWSHVRSGDGHGERNAHGERESPDFNPSDRLRLGYLEADSYL
jgi:hypothetical protein